MLVLSRKIGEQVLIANEIKVVVLKVNGAKVVIGVEAPKEIPIRRDDAKKKEAA